MEPSDPRNPFFGLVERVLALASAADAFPSALGYLEALAKKQPEPIKPVERQLFAKKPPSMDGARAGLRQEGARGGLVLEGLLGHPDATRCDAARAARHG